MAAERKSLKLSELEVNNGQIEGLPKNPRFIKDYRYKALKKSIEDAPEMLDYRTLCVYPNGKKYVILCGNMRYRACKEIGYAELPCYVLPKETPVEKLREWVIKDNIGFGSDDFDLIANEWDEGELVEWGMELPEKNFLEEEPTDLDAENENKPFVVKLTFENPQDIDKFMKAYADNLRADYRCIISISGGEL